MAESSQAPQVRQWLTELQQSICAGISDIAPMDTWKKDAWTRDDQGKLRGGGDTRLIEDGAVIERGGVNFSDVRGDALPPAASARKPELAGRSFIATGVSLVLHPRNPYVPTSHMNVRYFEAQKPGEPPVWWFGGGFDLTPYYPFDDDIRHWHATAKAAAGEHYMSFKQQCDRYFYLKHRDETRGVGGLFYDDFNTPDFHSAFALTKRVGEAFTEAYLPIVQRRMDIPFTDREQQFQRYRRGRYVEFNLVYDRGTLFGLQSGGRTESILMSMPPVAHWQYDYQPTPGSAEAVLADYLKPRDWI